MRRGNLRCTGHFCADHPVFRISKPVMIRFRFPCAGSFAGWLLLRGSRHAEAVLRSGGRGGFCGSGSVFRRPRHGKTGRVRRKSCKKTVRARKKRVEKRAGMEYTEAEAPHCGVRAAAPGGSSAANCSRAGTRSRFGRICPIPAIPRRAGDRSRAGNRASPGTASASGILSILSAPS